MKTIETLKVTWKNKIDELIKLENESHSRYRSGQILALNRCLMDIFELDNPNNCGLSAWDEGFFKLPSNEKLP